MINRLTLKQILPYTLGLLALDLICTFILWSRDTTGVTNLDGSYTEAGSSDLLKGLLTGLLVSAPIISLIFGTITAIFINREMSYGKRYPKAALLTLTFLYAMFGLGGIIRVIFG